ncbi:hypothetical protein Poli38472_008866 [Pythium oligandrum]|uniref:Uncharacterized protein n=1 Tax=Pythium oligandrum TaxID=41045 RepID=A0A8K1FEV9_PYTOL|nr:hypothetical protein Poli38472_008866 [Pythium oligandrum]|eukprot:TMW56218.1 hypothetical protein Poli38472_008866 [Pythium oligandrum]
MRTRIWEDTAAMNIVSVLAFLLNDEGDVVGPERTQVLCKLMPSIHTPTHRAMLAMLVTGLSDADTQTFYAEKGLKVLNEWLLEGMRKGGGGSLQKQRIELFAQVRALLRVLDINVQTDATRKQNAFLGETLVKLVDLLENSGPEFSAEWSRLNIFRRHFESTCGIPSTVKETRAIESKPTLVRHSSFTLSSASAAAAASTTSSSSVTTPKISPASVLNYQNKPFLQPKEPKENDDDDNEFLDDDEEDMEIGEEVITNVTQPAMSASLDAKIRANGHNMSYGQRTHCRLCRRMTAKRCDRCSWCVKCTQKDRCSPMQSASTADSAGNGRNSLSTTDKNVQVLGSAMDQAIYKAFKAEDFHSVFSLVQNGMDVNFQRVESDGSSALMAAAHHGREDAVNKLLSLGADPSLKDNSGDMAWAFAKRRHHLELADKLKKAADEWKSS